ncbi:primosomal protein N' [Aliikangiella maris]|uniref:Primosomal protein N n=2 Tax=Aliikangiella maris TaxID=3162458 RepID=A0ABV2BXL0_9GAMM
MDSILNLAANTQEHRVVVGVAIAVPLRRVFHYLVPADYAIEPQAGMRVKVPFGKSTKIGIITECLSVAQWEETSKLAASTHAANIDNQASSHSAALLKQPGEQQSLLANPPAVAALKTLLSIIDSSPLLPDSLLQLYFWLEKYYHAPPGEIWQTLLPVALQKGQPAESPRESRWCITPQGEAALQQNRLAKNAVKQRLALDSLSQHADGIAHEQLQQHQLSLATMKSLAGKNWVIRRFQQVSDNNQNHHRGSVIHSHNQLDLNAQQAAAVSQINQSLNQFKSFLLFGITASGKTEVYLQVIEKVLASGKQALVLVPEIGLTPQTLSRFQLRFNAEILLLHSAMTDQQRLQNWLKARSGQASIIIGTRSAVFTPLKHPGIIILDEEHDLSFRQQQGFRYSARDVALVRASIENIPVVLGSASPSLETLMNVHKGKIEAIHLTQKAKATNELNYRIIDLKKQAIQQGLSIELIQLIKQHLNQQGQILLFLNRRGYAPVLLCHDCGWSGSCSRCDIHFTYHHQNHFLQCHHCGSSRKAPAQCPDCYSEQMVPVGHGTERLQESIRQLFPQAKTARIDRDTTRRKSAMQEFVTAVKSGEIDILIGTQMLAKGHHFPDVTLVALIDMDGALYSADFRAPEFAAQLITQVSGRAGRANKPGEVIIQTHLAEHPMLHQIIFEGYASFADAALAERIETELPPFSYSAMFQAESPHLNATQKFLDDVKEILLRYQNLNVELLGPAPAIYTKKAGKFRYQLYLQTTSRNQLHQLLALTLNDIEALKSASKVRWRVELDPMGDY